ALWYDRGRQVSEESFQRRRIIGVEGGGAQRADLARGALEARAIPGREDHFAPLSARSSGGFEPDAGAAADHDDGLSEEFRLARDGRGGGCGAHDSSNQQSEITFASLSAVVLNIRVPALTPDRATLDPGASRKISPGLRSDFNLHVGADH